MSNPLKQRRTLIFGCGYVGRPVARRWLEAGDRVAIVTRSPAKADTLQSDGAEAIVADVSDVDAEAPGLPPADVVLWSVGFDRSPGADKRKLYVDGLCQALNWLSQPPSRVIVLSSISVYGQSAGEFVDEDSPAQPTSEGGEVCLEAQHAAAALVRERFPDCRLSFLRLAGIYGPGRVLRRQSDLQQGLPISGNASAWLNLIHRDDAAAVIDAVSRTAQPPFLLNVSDGHPVTRQEYYRTLSSLSDSPPPVFDESASGGTRTSGLNKRVTSRSLANIENLSLQFTDFQCGLAHALSHDVD